jgi:sulfur carrier protein ThiS
MKVTVKAYGTWAQRFPDYQPALGAEVEVPEGATVKDLLALLELPQSRGAVVIAEGRVLKADDELQPGILVRIMQTVGGG